MSRQKISEYTAKQALFSCFDLPFYGYSVTTHTTASELRTHFGNQNLVLKLDQGVKKRGLLGFVKVNVTPSEIPALVQAWAKSGWTNFYAEPVVEHATASEHYLAIERTRTNWQISYSPKGGVEIESHWDLVTHTLPPALQSFVNSKLIPELEKLHLVFLEMNPVLMRSNSIIPLDMAAEVDSAASPLPTLPDRALSLPEQQIITLDNSTPASLKFRLLNPKGRIWMLLSGGGASLVLADEVADLGLGSDLANYGEYSGAPTDDDVYAYTKIILNQILSQPITHGSLPMAIVIAGGVANFTDVAKTFTGLIRALDEQKLALQKNHVRVFVRRGGPNEEKGLSLMRDFLTQSSLLGSVHGHDTPLTEVVTEIKNYLVGAGSSRPQFRRGETWLARKPGQKI